MEHVIEINGKPYRQITDYTVSYQQTWAEGAERDFGGTWNGTLLGNFDSVSFSLLPENKQELSTLTKDLRKGIIKVRYYDHEAMGMITKTFYRVNYDVKSIYISEYDVHVDLVNIKFIPERRR